MIRESPVKRLTAVIFVLALFIGFFKSGSLLQLPNAARYLTDGEDAVTLDTLEAGLSSTLWHRQDLIDLNGTMANLLNMQGFYSDIGMYVTDDKYIVSASDDTTTDYEVEQTVNFNAFLAGHGIRLLYVNEPTKYVDDDLFRREFGIETFCNRNADVFLSRIRQAGVSAIDLRENIRAEKLNISDLFYRTDHHWTTRTGLWAARIIAEGLNTFCGYSIDSSIYDETNYTITDWSACWLGEQGRKVAQTYVGLDDYTSIRPSFPTSYTFKADSGSYDGTFDGFINESIYNFDIKPTESPSWHYSYSQINCVNHNVESGKVLILGDSYEQVTQPFLSLAVHETDCLILRNYNDSFNLKDYILANGYDTVIICYAQFMIGAHDDPSSANYRMFTFE